MTFHIETERKKLPGEFNLCPYRSNTTATLRETRMEFTGSLNCFFRSFIVLRPVTSWTDM